MNIEISEGTYNRLLEKMGADETCELVIRRLLDSHITTSTQKNTKPPAEQSDEDSPVLEKSEFPNNMSQTKLNRFLINDIWHETVNWNKAVRIILILLEKKGRNVLSLDCPGLVVREGKYNKANYTYLPMIDKSVQGVNAMSAVRIINYLAYKNKMDAELIFSWKNREDALHPGEQGKIIMTPSKE